MAKRLTEIQKKVIINDFVNGVTIDKLSKKFSCTKLTIVRNLKKNLSESKYNSILKKNKTSKLNLSETIITPNQLASNNEENNILVYDKYLTNYPHKSTMKTIYAKADILSLHVPLTNSTNYLINNIL